jgi:hypothetical protein
MSVPGRMADAGRRPRRCRCGADRRRSASFADWPRARPRCGGTARDAPRRCWSRRSAGSRHDRCPRRRRAARRRPAWPCSRHGRAHAQARIGVDVVGADQALGQFVEDVVILGQQLAADVEGDAVGAVLADGAGELLRRVVERRIPTARRRGAALSRRSCGCVRRCAIACGVMVRCSVPPLVHSRPKLAGCSGSPRTPVICVASCSMMTPQPTPQ